MSTSDLRPPTVTWPDSRAIRARLRVAQRASLLLGAGALLAWLTRADRAVFLTVAASPALQALLPIGEAYSTWGLFLFYAPFLLALLMGLREHHARLRTVGQAYLLAQACGTVVAVHLIKLVTARPRPPSDALRHVPGLAAALHSSFPSSHAVDVMVGAIFASLLTRSRATAMLALGAAGLMAGARVIIGKHYVSDVLAGLALGTAIAAVAIRVFLLPRWQALESGPAR